MAGLERGPTNPQPMALSFNNTPDLIAWLPEGAAERLRLLRQRSSDLNRLIPASDDRLAAGAARVVAEQHLSRLQAHQSARGGGYNLKPTDPRVIEAKKDVDERTATAKRINDLYETRAAAWTAVSNVLSNAERWLKDRPGTMVDYDGEVPKPNKGESLLDCIERHRRRGRELKADLHRIRSAPFPSNHCKAQMREQIEQLAQRGAVNVSLLVERDGPVEFPSQMLMVPVRGAQGASGTVEVIDTVAMFAWLHRDALLKKIETEIDAESDDKAALSHDARKKAEAVVMGDLLACERDESALVFQAQAQGLPVEHRSDISPVALLDVVVTAPHATTPGTSPGMSWAR